MIFRLIGKKILSRYVGLDVVFKVFDFSGTGDDVCIEIDSLEDLIALDGVLKNCNSHFDCLILRGNEITIKEYTS